MTALLEVTRTLRERDVTGSACPCGVRRTNLADLSTGESAVVLGVCDEARPEVARRLVDLGFVPGARVTRERRAPLRDPITVRVADYELTLRLAQARCISVVEARP